MASKQNQENAVAANKRLFAMGCLPSVQESVEATAPRQYVLLCGEQIAAEFRNGVVALQEMYKRGEGHLLFDRVKRKIIASV